METHRINGLFFISDFNSLKDVRMYFDERARSGNAEFLIRNLPQPKTTDGRDWRSPKRIWSQVKIF